MPVVTEGMGLLRMMKTTREGFVADMKKLGAAIIRLACGVWIRGVGIIVIKWRIHTAMYFRRPLEAKRDQVFAYWLLGAYPIRPLLSPACEWE